MRRLWLLLMSLLVAVGVWQAAHQLRVCERLAYTAGVNLGWHIYTTALLDYALYTAADPFLRIHEDGSWWFHPAADAIEAKRSDLKRFERDISRYTRACGERREVLSPWAAATATVQMFKRF